MDKQPAEIIEKVMSHLSIKDGAALTNAANLHSDLLRRRADPVLYLSKTFKYAVSLIAVMADEGGLFSGSMIQEFMIPGSTDDSSDWDIYLPGNAKAVTSVLSILSECGTEFKWLGDD